MDEAFLSSNLWNTIYEILPKLNETVLVFRQSNKKYVVARILENKNKEENQDDHTHCWVTQQNLCYPVDADDLWFSFPYVKLERIYD
jgi:hypothetical protein